MAKVLSSDRGAASSKPGAGGARVDYAIKGERGLRLRVTGDKRGGVSRVWSLLYTRKSDSKKCRLTLGEYPALSLSEACHLASRHRNEAWEGKDPAAERRKAKEALTFERLALLWLERHAKVKKRSWAEDERMMRTNLLPTLGAKKAESIAKSDVVATIHKIMDRGACYQANRNLALLRTIFNWAIDHDLVETNPALRIPRPAEEIERMRVLSEAEIRQFFAMIGSAPMTRPVQIALELALLTGARISEILEARKSEFDLTQSLWTIPGRRPLPRVKKLEGGTKNKLDHVLPLGDLTRTRIEEAFVFSKDSEWLFPSPKGAGFEPVGDKAASRAWRRVRSGLGLDDIHVHDFRRTYGTVAGSLGYNDFEVGICLNHKTARGKVTSIYNRFQYLPEKTQLTADVDRYFASLMPERAKPEREIVSEGVAV
jgi:integrase